MGLSRKSDDWWDRFWRRPPPARGRDLTCRRTAEEALRLLEPTLARSGRDGRPARIMDLGCGNGDLSPLLLRDPRIELVALDVSAEALAQFRARLGGRPTERLGLVRGDVYRLPCPDGAFDALVSFGYASAASYSGIERELARVLRPGGVAVVDFAHPSLYHWLSAPRATLRWYRRFRDPREGQYHFGRRGVAAHFGPAGLVPERVGYLNAYPPLRMLAGRRWSAALDRHMSRAFGGALGRVLLVRLRRV